MGKGLEAIDAVHEAPHPLPYPLKRAIHNCTNHSPGVKVASCRYYSLDSPHPAQGSSRGKETLDHPP